MILKIFGAATIVVCCSLIGIRCAGVYSQRVKTLRALIGTLTVARSEICDLLSPIPELFELLSHSAPAAAKGFWRDCDRLIRAGLGIPEAWKTAADGIRYIDEACREAVSGLAGVIGRYDAEAQRDEITRTVGILEKALADAESERGGRSRTCAALGVAVGVMLAIILV